MANGLKAEIDYWKCQLGNLPDEQKTGELYLRMIEMAFFKIFVKFEDFLSFKFKKYCVGESNSNGNYTPERKLEFENLNHLEGMLNSGKTYIDYLPTIQKTSSHIFKKDPFNLIFGSTYSDGYNKMKAIRNYIAHESAESKKKYCTHVLNKPPADFISPGEYLKKIPKGKRTSNFDLFIKEIEEQRIILIDPSSFFQTTP